VHDGGGRVRLIPVDGSPQVKTTKGCPTRFAPWVMNHSAVWSGCGGRFTVLSPDGTVHVSTHRYGAWMASAYGELAVATRSGHKIALVTSANGTSKVLVRTK
jgi:hypothetical protein